MNNQKCLLRIIILSGLILLLPSLIFTQSYILKRSVFSCGGSRITGVNNSLNGTLSQTAIGITLSVNENNNYVGFWYDKVTNPISLFQIPLSQGWNMISSNIKPQEPDSLQYVTVNIIDNLVIAKNNNGEVYIPSYDINNIGKWDVTQGYQVYMSEVDTLVVTGLAVNPSETHIILNEGWNMISYLRNTEMDCETVFSSLTDNGNLIIVKDNEGRVYIPSYEINTIGNLVPGQGYQIYILNADVLVYPGN